MDDVVAEMRRLRDTMDPLEPTGARSPMSTTPVAAPRSPSPSPLDEDSDDEAECRVCRGEAEPDRRLFAPCKCSGSIRFTHSDCLEQWLEHSGKSFCELCGYKFEFQPLYDQDAPAVLPYRELLTTVLRMVCCKWVPFLVRAVLVGVLWLGVAPWCTSWLYRMWLLRASAMVNVNFAERFDRAHVVADIFAGIVLIVVVIFSFLALMSFADFLRFHLDHIDEPVEDPHPHPHPQPQPQPHPHHHHPHHHHQQQHVQPPVPVRRAMNEQEDEVAAVPAAVAVAEPEPMRLEHQDEGQDPREGHERNPFDGVFERHPREQLGLPVLGAAQDRVDALNEHAIPEQDEDPMPMAQELRQRRGAQPLPPPPPQPQRNAHDHQHGHGGHANANNANANRAAPVPEWEDDFEHMEINIAMDELLGLRGDLVVLFRNVSWLLAFNGAYLGLFAFIPYTLGSTILSAGGKITSGIVAPMVAPALAAAQDLKLMGLLHYVEVVPFLVHTLGEAMDVAKARGDCLQLVDLCTCAVGYLSICSTIVVWRWMVTTASSYIHRPLMGGVLWALRCLTAIVKVSTLLLLKMVVLPIVLGLGIDFATLRLFLVTPQERIAMCLFNMIGALAVHWVLGITFMLFITVSVLQLREVMHPDILARVIRPQEAHPDLLRSLLSDNCVKHARRMLLSLLIYAALLAVLIHVPIRVMQSVAPTWFPLQLRFQHYIPEVQVPMELLMVHLIVLGVLEQAKNGIGRLQHVGIRTACQWLGLTEYLLPVVKATWAPTHGQQRLLPHQGAADDIPLHVLPPPPLHFHPHAEMPPEELQIHGHRYLPWPEDGLEDAQPMEYDLLPRHKPTYVTARLVAMAVVSWLVLVGCIGVLFFGTFFLGRVCLGPFERWTGIAHDPLAMAAGVEIMCDLLNGLNALNVVTRSEDHIEPALVERGYSVRNMTPLNAVTSVVGWAFVCPFLVGYLVSACFPTANASWFESFWMGYLLFNLFAWFVCCFRATRHRRRRRHHREAPPMDDEFEEERFDDFVGHRDEDDDLDDEDDEDDLLDDDDELLDDEDDEEERNHEQMGGEVPADGADAAAAARPGAAAAAAIPEDFIGALRRSYKQILFNMRVHSNDAVRLRRDNIHERCFDVAYFNERVLYPAVTMLAAIVVICTVQSAVLVYFCDVMHVDLPATSFAISAIGTAVSTFLVRSHALVGKWMADFAESIRNERYLIGRELQDMVR